MEIVELEVRKAYIASLSNLIVEGKVIPVFEEIVNHSQEIPKITISGVKAQAYVILLNQRSNDQSPKDLQNDEVVTHVQINTIFPYGKGGSMLSEKIAKEVYNQLALHPLTPDAPVTIWMHRRITSANIPYHTENSSVWVYQIVFEDHVNQ